jgi:O-6-methylguanine DNA methyltransferase
VQITYTTFPTKLGPVFLAKSKQGICRVHLGGSEEEFRTVLRKKYHGTPTRDDPGLNSVVQELRSYFEEGKPIDGMPVEFLEGTPFERNVWKVLARIPRGQVKSYGWVATQIGTPKASRAVGGACGSNPVPFIIPCHRVIASNGRLGGYGYGLEVKRELLRLEGVETSTLKDRLL